MAKSTANVPATQPNKNAPPPALMEQMAQDAGRGVSSAQDDNLVPLIYILQAQSPQVNKRSPDYLEGAEAGSLWLRSAPNPIVDGEQGLLFQPCYFTKDWVEWVPRDSGGGYVGRHEECPQDAERREDPKNPNRTKFVRPNGNEVVETRYHIGFAILPDGPALPYVIPMSSSGHTVSRQWMFQMNSKQIAGGTAPSWSSLYRLKTKERSNAAGTWFTWDISDAGWVQSVEEYRRGSDLNKAFASGAKVMDEPEADPVPATGDNAAM